MRGAPSAEVALLQLLRGSGLTYERRGATFLVVRSDAATLAGKAKTRRQAANDRPSPQGLLAKAGVDDERRDPDNPSPIIVTGTHIARPELESAMPISIVRMEDARAFARDTIYDALLLNPAIGPGLGDSNSQGQEYDTGVANINLRNMGNNRSLVVVDGQRWVSSGARTSAVDLNTIPAAMIDRIEVVTGGAAAIYGADTVTGVVNIVMKKTITGLSVSVTDGVSQRGDANQSNMQAATGFNFDSDRGHFAIGGDYTHTAPVRWAERYTRRQTYYANPANTGPNDGIPDNITANNYGSLYRSSVPAFYVDNQWYQLHGGAVMAVAFDTVVTPGETGTGDGGPIVTGFENHLLRNASEKVSLYSRLGYALTPAMRWNATVNYAHSFTRAVPEWPEVRTDARPANWWGGTTGEIATLANPYLPDAIRAFMVARNLTALPLDRTYFNLPQAYESHRRDNIMLGTDIGGKLTRSLSWSAFARYGQVTDRIVTTNMVGKTEWLYARDAVRDPASGQIVCGNPAARANGCQPLNFFSIEPYSPALLDYIEHRRNEWNRNTLINAGANLSGRVFSLPHGDASIVAGIEWRRETLHTHDDPDTAKLADIVFSPGEDYALHPALSASRDTTELYGEVMLPLLKDQRFARRLEIEGAYRFSHYSDDPITHTWKAGGSWELVAGLTLRGVYSHSIRVPNFGELYVPISQVTYGHITDPCQAGSITQNANRAANCAAILPGVSLPLPNPNLNAPVVYSGGNPRLTPETSNSYTLGLVLKPTFLRGFDLTVDYWDISIDNVITALSYTTILDACVDSADGPDYVYCQFIRRNADGTVNAVEAQYANLAGQHARGIDIGANHRVPMGDGMLRLGFGGTYLLEQTTISRIGSAGTDYVGLWTYPRFKATLMTSYAVGKLAIGISSRFISRSKYSATAASDETYEFSHIPAYLYNDLTLQFRPTAKWSLTFGAKNVSNAGVFPPLQDTAPGPHGAGGVATGAAYYDAIGRYFFVKVDVSL